MTKENEPQKATGPEFPRFNTFKVMKTLFELWCEQYNLEGEIIECSPRTDEA